MASIYIGLISGTSADGIDAVAVRFKNNQIKQIGAITHQYTPDCRNKILTIQTQAISLSQIGQLDTLIGEQFAQATSLLIKKFSLDKRQIKAIGSHGQTLKHAPNGSLPFSLQLGNPSLIAERTQITTIANFRQKDIAAGGQGAPLVPAFHQAWLSNMTKSACVLNLGGIANLTILGQDSTSPIMGFDCGPANTLMDAWMRREYQQPYDTNGENARTGRVNTHLLNQLLVHDYFKQIPPKSADIDQFSLQWLDSILNNIQAIKAEDITRTLCELTISSVAAAIERYAPTIETVIACGGGCKNSFLMEMLAAKIDPIKVKLSDDYGVGSDWVEGVAFAWLAKQTLLQLPGNAPLATGASHECILGGIYHP